MLIDGHQITTQIISGLVDHHCMSMSGAWSTAYAVNLIERSSTPISTAPRFVHTRDMFTNMSLLQTKDDCSNGDKISSRWVPSMSDAENRNCSDCLHLYHFIPWRIHLLFEFISRRENKMFTKESIDLCDSFHMSYGLDDTIYPLCRCYRHIHN